MFTAKKKEKNAWMSYWKPFSLGLWLANLAGIVVLTLTLWFIRAKEGEDRDLQSLTISTNLLLVWSATCMQGMAIFAENFVFEVARNKVKRR